MTPENVGSFNVVPYGPYHFAIHEPIFFKFYVDGERIASVDLRAGFNYRGLEKIAETRMSYETVPFIAERICGICGSVHSEAYTQALERAAAFEAPERAKWIRVVMLEIERIHSHLLWLGVASHMGASTPGSCNSGGLGTESCSLPSCLQATGNSMA